MDNNKKKLLQSAAKVSGALLGATVGTAVSGPVGGIGGALVGTVAEFLVEWGTTEISSRVLSKKEKQRVETVYDVAIKTIEERIKNGEKLRNDGFFDASIDERSPAEEVLEGVLLCAQREHEERKIIYLAKLYANLCFRNDISCEVANSLIKHANELTFRECVIMKCIAICQNNAHIHKKSAYTQVVGLENISIATDTYSLYSKGILQSASGSALLSAGGVDPSDLQVGGIGVFLYQLMELETLPFDELFAKTFSFFSNTIIE